MAVFYELLRENCNESAKEECSTIMLKDVPKLTREEVVHRALNEHGFLLQSRISEFLLSEKIGEWHVEAMEFPISFGVHHDETRVDLVLSRHVPKHNQTWLIPIECKRPNPSFKTWVFFDQRERIVRGGGNRLFVQAHDLYGGWTGSDEPPLTKRVISFTPQHSMPELFNFYVEARENSPGQRDSASSTKAIEDAFYQLMLGSVGLGREFQRLHRINYRLIPVVLTTAELCAADYAPEKVDVATGTLAFDDLKLRPLDWLCVNYAIGENLAALAELSSTRGRSLSEALSYRLLRSVFVVRTTKLGAFLKWVDGLADMGLA